MPPPWHADPFPVFPRQPGHTSSMITLCTLYVNLMAACVFICSASCLGSQHLVQRWFVEDSKKKNPPKTTPKKHTKKP